MAIEISLRSLLWNQPAIANLVPAQSPTGTVQPGIFNEFPPQGFDPPFILVQLVSYDPLTALETTGGMAKAEIEASCYHVTYKKCSDIAETVKAFITNYKGAAGNDVIDSVDLRDKKYDAVLKDDGSDVRYHILTLSLDVFHH